MKDARVATRRGEQPAGAVALIPGAVRAGLLVVAAAALLTTVPASAQCHPAVIDLLSQTARGMAAEGSSNAPVVNENGLVTAYSSDAIDLVSPPMRAVRDQVYARDLEQVLSQLVSVGSGNQAGNQPSQNSGFPPGISADGRFIAFSSLATNLVTDNTNGLENVYVYDRQDDTIELITRGMAGPANGLSTLPKISADGRYVVFQSTATNLVSEAGTAPIDVYLFDRTAGSTQRVSVASDGTPGNGQSITPNISEDGLVVTFASRATNLVAQPTSGLFEQIYAREWQAGTTEMISVSSSGMPGNDASFLPDPSRDGSQIAFKSQAFNLVANDTNGVPDVFVRDRTAGTTQRVSVDDFGNQANGLSGGPGISADGRFVAFPSFASNFDPEDGNGQSDIYVYDRFPSGFHHIARVTVGLDCSEPDQGVADFPATISADGRWIGFSSAATNLVPNDFNNSPDAFLACNPFDAFDCAPPTPTPSVTPTATVGAKPCVGDCNGDGEVTIDDLIRMVNIALGLSSICPNDSNGGCLAGDATCDCQVTVDEIIRAVQNSLQGCHDFGDCTLDQEQEMCCEAPPVTGSPTATRTVTPTPPPVTPSATPTTSGVGLCVGDCSGTGDVSIDDLIRMVNIALGLQSLCPSGGMGGCLAGDSSCTCDISVDEIVQAVDNALNGCTIFNTCDPTQHVAMCCS